MRNLRVPSSLTIQVLGYQMIFYWKGWLIVKPMFLWNPGKGDSHSKPPFFWCKLLVSGRVINILFNCPVGSPNGYSNWWFGPGGLGFWGVPIRIPIPKSISGIQSESKPPNAPNYQLTISWLVDCETHKCFFNGHINGELSSSFCASENLKMEADTPKVKRGGLQNLNFLRGSVRKEIG